MKKIILLPLLCMLSILNVFSQVSPGPYTWWPTYNFIDDSSVDTIQAQVWINHDNVINGWDWSLPGFVEPSARSSVGLERIFGTNKAFKSYNFKFKTNPVGLLWVKWREIEPTEGDFNWQPIINRIKQANSVGMDISLRILSYSKERNGTAGEAPLWLENLGVTLLPKTGDNLNFNPQHPVFHKQYLELIASLAQSGVPQMVKAAYTGWASPTYGDEGIGPYGEGNPEANDTVKVVREHLDAWQAAFNGIENKVFMGGTSIYGFEKGFGMRRGFVERYQYHIPDKYLGQFVDKNGYLYVDETAPIISYKCFNGEVNEEYQEFESSRHGSLESFSYRYFTSTLRALQMRCTYVHTTGHLMPQMLPFLSQELGRTVKDAPDVWTFLRASYHKPGVFKVEDNNGVNLTSMAYVEVKNYERWLYQRDAAGYETEPAVKVGHSNSALWMIDPNMYYDYVARKGKKIGFDIDDRWAGTKDTTAIKVTYFDNNAGELNLLYKNTSGQVKKTQSLNGDGGLKTVTFFVSGIQANSLEHNFDFVLEAGENTENIVISFVRVVHSDVALEPVGIDQKPFNNNSEISVIYNANYKSITITSKNQLNQINLYNINGEKVRSEKCNGITCNFKTQGLNTGVYLIQLFEKSGIIQTKKIVLI